MKKKTVMDLWNVIMRLEELKSDIKFSYFIARNKMLLQKHVEELSKVQQPTQDFMEFEDKRVILLQQHADKDKNGRAQHCSQSNQYVVTVNRDRFNEEFAQLKDSYKDTLTSRDKQMTEYFKILDEDISIKLMKIKFSKLPREIQPIFLNIFMEADLIEEDNSEEENN